MDLTIAFTGLSGGAASPGTTFLLTYSSGASSARTVTVPAPPSGRLDAQTATSDGALVRVRAFAPPADLVFDRAFPPGHVFEAQMTIGLREPTPPPAIRRLSIAAPARRPLLTTRPLALETSAGRQVPVIPGLSLRGAPGTPALPVEVHRVLVPPSEQVTGVVAIPDPSPVRVAAPAPLIRPAPVKDLPRGRRPAITTPPRPFPPLIGTIPNQPVVLRSVEKHAWGSIATVELWPVQYDAAAREYVHQPNLAYTLTTVAGETPAAQEPLFPGIANRDDAETILGLLRNPLVSVSPAVLQASGFAVDPAALATPAPVGMVIIASDTTWPGSASPNPPFLAPTTFAAGGPVAINAEGNGPIAEFERLAYWKTARGMRTKVVPIPTIIAMNASGALAPYMAGAACDLPEMIRGFIQYAAALWQTRYVLLGGTKDIVPMRILPASIGSIDFARNAPPATASVVVLPGGSGRWYAKLWCPSSVVGDVDENYEPVSTGFSLMTVNGGFVLPYDAGGSGLRGWFVTSVSGFEIAGGGFPSIPYTPVAPGSTTNTPPICIIAFGGPEIDDDYTWIFPGRGTETDHYYSDLSRAAGGCKDFDASGNLLLGQVVPDQAGNQVPIDGMKVTGDVAVGRAPVADGDDARNFVNKVLAYETLLNADGSAADRAYLHRLTLIADNWAHPWNYAQSQAPAGTVAPQPAQYVWEGADVLLQLDLDADGDTLASTLTSQTVLDTPAFSLQAIFDPSGDVIDIPYDPQEDYATGWCYCDSAFKPLAPVAGTAATTYVRVRNAPIGFNVLFWQNPTMDYASAQKERVHTAWRQQFPTFAAVRRIYRDAPDFSGQDVEQVIGETVSAALDEGPHFLSTCGHGNAGQDALIGIRDNANAGRPFIMYAHSCETADPATTSLGASYVTQPNGALAYVGYSHCCNTEDLVADYELGFWCGVAQFRRVGWPVALHLNSANWQDFNHIFMMMLYGDPEMPVWVLPPRSLAVQANPGRLAVSASEVQAFVSVIATDNGQPVPGLLVTVLQGWTGSQQDPVWYASTTTDDLGTAQVAVATPQTQAVRVVVSTPPGWSRQQYAPSITDFAAGQFS